MGKYLYASLEFILLICLFVNFFYIPLLRLFCIEFLSHQKSRHTKIYISPKNRLLLYLTPLDLIFAISLTILLKYKKSEIESVRYWLPYEAFKSRHGESPNGVAVCNQYLFYETIQLYIGSCNLPYGIHLFVHSIRPSRAVPIPRTGKYGICFIPRPVAAHLQLF